VRPIETCQRFGQVVPLRAGMPPQLTVAGIVMLRQKPSSANGVMFITLEDETGFVQCVVRPEAQGRLGHVLTRSALIVQGELHADGNWRGLVVHGAWALDGIFGGYEGYASASGGRDRHIVATDEAPSAEQHHRN